MRVIHLGEVEVTARIIRKEEEPRLEFWANKSIEGITADGKIIRQVEKIQIE